MKYVADKDMDALYDAVAEYVKSRGGSVVVVGGIQILHEEESRDRNFLVAVRCTGTPPSHKKVEETP